MILKEITSQDFASIYEDHMLQDFPASELKPLERITETMEQGMCKVFTLVEKNEMKAYAVLIFPQDGKHVLLDYFAVNKKFRGQGIGHQFFMTFVPYIKEQYPEIEGMFIESERVELDRDDVEIRTRRINFYLDCGCKLTNLQSKLFGVTYSIFFLVIHSEKDVDYDDLDFIYQAMFKPKHYESEVSIWTIQ